MKRHTEKAHASIDKTMKDALVQRAEQEQRSEGSVIRLALAAYLNKQEATK